jgi:hypothetical protein
MARNKISLEFSFWCFSFAFLLVPHESCLVNYLAGIMAGLAISISWSES